MTRPTLAAIRERDAAWNGHEGDMPTNAHGARDRRALLAEVDRLDRENEALRAFLAGPGVNKAPPAGKPIEVLVHGDWKPCTVRDAADRYGAGSFLAYQNDGFCNWALQVWRALAPTTEPTGTAKPADNEGETR